MGDSAEEWAARRVIEVAGWLLVRPTAELPDDRRHRGLPEVWVIKRPGEATGCAVVSGSREAGWSFAGLPFGKTSYAALGVPREVHDVFVDEQAARAVEGALARGV